MPLFTCHENVQWTLTRAKARENISKNPFRNRHMSESPVVQPSPLRVESSCTDAMILRFTYKSTDAPLNRCNHLEVAQNAFTLAFPTRRSYLAFSRLIQPFLQSPRWDTLVTTRTFYSVSRYTDRWDLEHSKRYEQSLSRRMFNNKSFTPHADVCSTTRRVLFV
jgi:hypothetical protein